MKLYDDHPVFKTNDAEGRVSRPRHVVELLRILDRSRENSLEPLVLIEIGTIRADTDYEREGAGHSTVHFARFASQGDHLFFSVDISPRSCREAMAVLQRSGLLYYTSVVQQDGLEYLKLCEDSSVDFVYLDADFDPKLTKDMLGESLRVIRSSGLICLDDCQEPLPNEMDRHKGAIVVPWLRELGVKLRYVGERILVLDPQEVLDARDNR